MHHTGCFLVTFILLLRHLFRRHQCIMAKHPLQRLDSPSRTASLILHIVGIASFSCCFDDLRHHETPLAASYGSHYQYLTILGLSAALFSFVMGLMADITLYQRFFSSKECDCCGGNAGGGRGLDPVLEHSHD